MFFVLIDICFHCIGSFWLILLSFFDWLCVCRHLASFVCSCFGSFLTGGGGVGGSAKPSGPKVPGPMGCCLNLDGQVGRLFVSSSSPFQRLYLKKQKTGKIRLGESHWRFRLTFFRHFTSQLLGEFRKKGNWRCSGHWQLGLPSCELDGLAWVSS